MAKRQKPLTLCGVRPRAWVVGHTDTQLTYAWPCGYQRTEPLMIGRGRRRLLAGASVVAFFARYWRQGQGVTYECPRCRRAARRG